MTSRLAALLVLPAVLMLAGCVPTSAPSAHKTTAVHTATSPTPSATPTPVEVDPAGFLTQGAPGVPDSDGEWLGRYTFFTDSSKSVLCSMTVFSGDPGGIACQILPDSISKRTYALPAGITSTCSPIGSQGSYTDGSEIDMGSEALYPDNVGWEGCTTDPQIDPSILAATKVLKPNQVLTITHDSERWTCTVPSVGIAHCTSAQSATASLTLGLTQASFTQ